MRRKRVYIRYRKERCILSDVLPYEVPLTFTNRHFYDFLQANRIECRDGTISWLAGSAELDEIVRIMFALNSEPLRKTSVPRFVGQKKVPFSDFDVYNGRGKAPPKGLIPFGYKIDHGVSEFRELSLPHPRNQLEVVDFYDTCKETILYFASLSPYSIRRPVKLAQYTYYKDRTHYDRLADDQGVVEQFDSEYEHLRSFFVYRQYSNVYKFYESTLYHRCEKTYNAMLKLDVSKCFDSIYTHSVGWALLGKEVIKEHLRASNSTFAGRFDQLMQRMNYNETNGIIIGPEVSRVFAELILQSIDQRVERKLWRLDPPIIHKVHYQAFRYVDDYFIFYNDERHRDVIVEVLQHTLREFRLHLNAAKAIVYQKPIITEISRAKRQIANLLDDALAYKGLPDSAGEGEVAEPTGHIHINSKSLIIEFKTILKVCGVEYRDLLNYTLTLVEKKCEKILRTYQAIRKDGAAQRQLANAIIGVLEFVFFIYSVSPRVNTTIRVCRVLRMLCSFFRSPSITYDHKHLVYKCIFDDICMVLKKNSSDEYTQVETLYLLVALAELGKEYWLEEDVLAGYFGLRKDPTSGDRHECWELSYFSLTVLLFYMRGRKRYDDLRACVERSVLAKFRRSPATLLQEAELTFLFFDMLACPYVSKATKYQLLDLYDVTDRPLQDRILNYRIEDASPQQWFTTWHNFDFGKELDRKKGLEVY